tara:strand:+ start:1502 stop:1720 length:219 start_codon:yes stop_codon:yes gene_type:complete
MWKRGVASDQRRAVRGEWCRGDARRRAVAPQLLLRGGGALPLAMVGKWPRLSAHGASRNLVRDADELGARWN